jgi:hypothetical protein
MGGLIFILIAVIAGGITIAFHRYNSAKSGKSSVTGGGTLSGDSSNEDRTSDNSTKFEM